MCTNENICNLIICPSAALMTCVIEGEENHPALEAVMQYHWVPSAAVKIKCRPAFKWGITGIS